MTEDAELLAQYADNRSEAAVAELVRRHIGVVYHAALRRTHGRSDIAQDITQLVFEKAVREARSLSRHPTVVGWLHLATRHSANDVLRAERRRLRHEADSAAMSELLSSGQTLDWEHLRPVLDEMLDRLPAIDREAILLRYFEGQSYAGVGASLRLSQEAARKRVDRATEQLRVLLKKRGITSTALALEAVLAGQTALAVPGSLAAGVTQSVIASVGSLAPSGLTVLQFMQTTKAALGVVAILGIVGAIGIGLPLHEHAAMLRAKAAAAAADRDAESQAQQIEKLRARILAAQRNIEATKSDLAAQVARSKGAAAKNGPKNLDKAAVRTALAGRAPVINRELSSNPDIRAALAGWMKANYQLEYGPLYKALNLTADQIAALGDLMLERNINMNVAWLTTRPDGVTPDQVEQSIHTLLGDADYAQFTQYEKTTFVRTVADGLAGNLFDTDTPLSSQQAEQLTQIFANNKVVPAGAPAAFPAFPNTVNWEAALPQAQAVLSPAQYAALQNEVTVITSGTGLWGAMNPLNPSGIGRGAGPPAAFILPGQGAPK